ncbi:MAG: hypothetical protein HKP54_09850 [Boseongicola sp.]|nr:hypothetical protein [Boseongicola sp.]
MTVLAKYQRLESEGVWRADEEAQRRDIIVSIGEATLTLTDLNEVALTHWSLPAIRRQNPGTRPAVYAPGEDTPETLEIADDEMIDAVEKVLRAVRKQGRHPGRLRNLIYGGLSVLVLVLAVFWLPGALSRYASHIIPEETRDNIGARLAADVERLTGAHCEDPTALAALNRLSQRLFPDATPQVLVLPSALETTQHLPGGTLLVSHKLVEDFETVDVLAGYLLAENLRRRTFDPFERLLKGAGLTAAFGLLTTGDISEDDLRAHAEALIVAEPLELTGDGLAAEFVQSEVKPDAYITAAAPPPQASETLSNASAQIPTSPLLTDSEWIALQQICET